MQPSGTQYIGIIDINYGVKAKSGVFEEIHTTENAVHQEKIPELVPQSKQRWYMLKVLSQYQSMEVSR